jgi:glycosyltransferase involved in cell wall biosynthesis
VINISVVIPTCNRKQRLLSLLKNLNDSVYSLQEVIVVDSGEDRIGEDEYEIFKNIPVIYTDSEKSVCIQRNKGIALAKSEWIFLCDDDIEVPADYIEKIAEHVNQHPDVVAVSALVLQKEKNNWTSQYPIKSVSDLLYKYIFKLSVWGEIQCKGNFISNKLKKYYGKKGNHISKAGWPVITDFSGEYFKVPVYGLGASVIKKEWLLNFPYDETLDSHGIGDNYGLSINFPANSIHILNNAFVYHHHENINRLQKSLQYYRRAMALDYFRRTNENLKFVKKGWLLWSLTGNLFGLIFARNTSMLKAGFKSIINVLSGSNPYLKQRSQNRKKTEIN